MHSFYNENREKEGKNIKGSPKILDAINRLKNDGYKVEYNKVNKIELDTSAVDKGSPSEPEEMANFISEIITEDNK